MALDVVLRDIKAKYELHLLSWSDERITLELWVLNTLFQSAGVAENPEEIEWYSLCYNYLEEELIKRGREGT